MKQADAIYDATSRMEDLPLRHLQVRQTKEILSVNEKIRAMVTLRKIEQYSKISEYIRKKNEDSKVKRTLYLRNKFMDGTGSVSSRRTSDHSVLNIDTCSNLKMLYQKNSHRMSPSRAEYVEALLAFEQDFKNGLMDEMYNDLLERYLSKIKEQYGSEQVSDLVREASKSIKDKLFKIYLKKKGRSKSPKNELLPRNKSNHSIVSVHEHHTDQPKADRKGLQHRSAQMSPKQSRCRPPVSFIYKQRSKFSERRLGSINKMYSGEVDTIGMANKVETKRRRLNQFVFLKRLKEHRSTTYRSILDIGHEPP